MATRDYVKRSQAQPNKRKNSKNKKDNNEQSAAWGKILLSLLVLGLFVFGLYRLSGIAVSDKQNSDNGNNVQDIENSQDEQTVDNASTLEQAIVEPLKPLPILAEEEWEYIDSLPDTEVQIDAVGPLESNKDFIMQCGSFRTQERAQELRAQIAFQGLESRILQSTGRTGLWHRVVLGPYDKKRDAERHRHQLRQSEIRGCKIW